MMLEFEADGSTRVGHYRPLLGLMGDSEGSPLLNDPFNFR
jgi:hypothetical protein